VAGWALPSLPPREAREKSAAQAPSASRPLGWVYAVTLLLACGFQFHVFVGSAVLYRQFVSVENLPWCLPVFWIGFKLMMLIAPSRVGEDKSARFLSGMAVLGCVALLLCLLAPNLPVLLLGQTLLGACWGGCFLAGIRTVQSWPTRWESGLALGGWFCMLSLATAGRISLDKMISLDALLLEKLALLLWLLAAVAAWKLLASQSLRVANPRS
jgi:predicted MFS family arabinose efflux permease